MTKNTSHTKAMTIPSKSHLKQLRLVKKKRREQLSKNINIQVITQSWMNMKEIIYKSKNWRRRWLDSELWKVNMRIISNYRQG